MKVMSAFLDTDLSVPTFFRIFLCLSYVCLSKPTVTVLKHVLVLYAGAVPLTRDSGLLPIS